MVAIARDRGVLADRVSTSARHYASLYRQASERLVTAHEEERASLARELHDGVGQTLTAVILTLDAAESELASPATGRRRDRATTGVLRARELASSALAETRQVAAKLRPTRVHEMGLGAALAQPRPVSRRARRAAASIRRRCRPACSIPSSRSTSTGSSRRRSATPRGTATRDTIWISGHCSSTTRVRLLVGDDGIGFDQPARGRGLGLDGMHERASIHGLDVDVRSRRGAGTRVELIVPTASIRHRCSTSSSTPRRGSHIDGPAAGTPGGASGAPRLSSASSASRSSTTTT